MLWIKAFHVVAVIAWMAALLYLPRLMVYHADVPAASPQSQTFKVMERRLLKVIATPAMIATWVLGLILVWQIEGWREAWFWAKAACVIVLSGFHGFLALAVREFAADKNVRGARFYRLSNEVPTVLMVAIVILVIVKPF